MANVELSVENGVDQARLVFGDGVPLGRQVVDAYGSQSHLEELEFLRLGIRSLRDAKDEESIRTVRTINRRFDSDTADLHEIEKFWIGPRVMTWLARASLNDLDYFCTWNVNRHERQQQALDAATPELRADTLERVDRLIAANFLPLHARGMFGRAVREIPKLHALDSFDAGGYMTDGHMTTGSQLAISIANLFKHPESFEVVTPHMKQTVFHEYSHVVTEITGTGLKRGIYHPALHDDLFAWVDEAIIEHMSFVSEDERYPLLNVMRPTLRPSTEQSGYREEREVLGLVMHMGDNPMTAKDVVAAHFEYPNRSRVIRHIVASKLLANFAVVMPEYGENALYEFSEAYVAKSPVERHIMARNAVARIAEQMGVTVQTAPKTH